MARSQLKSPAAFLAQSWQFFMQRGVLFYVLLWFLFLPVLLRTLLYTPDSPSPLLSIRDVELWSFLSFLASILLSVILVWGEACVLLVGKRMIQEKAGRARTSFRSVRQDALPLVVPLILTSLLQFCLIVYRVLLFIVPLVLILVLGKPPASMLAFVREYPHALLLLLLLLPSLLYYIQTFFFNVAIATEGSMYRSALGRSKELVEGKVLPVLWRLLCLAIFTVIPAGLLDGFLKDILRGSPLLLVLPVQIFTSAVAALAALLFTLSCLALFGNLRDVRETPKKPIRPRKTRESSRRNR